MNPFQKFVVRVCRINLENAAVKFNVEQALRATLQRGIEIGRKETPNCVTCPLWRAEQIRLTGNSEMFAGPNTDGDISVQHSAQPMDIMPAWFKKRNPHLIQTRIDVPRVHVTRDLRTLLNNDDREKKIS